VEATSILRETPTVDSRWVGVGLGAFIITVASLAWLGWELTATTGTGGPVWFPALTALIGVWFLFDARADFADSTSSDEPDDMSAQRGDAGDEPRSPRRRRAETGPEKLSPNSPMRAI